MEILPLLATAELVTKSGRTYEELEILADIFAEDLAGENIASVENAFALHRRRSKFFPTPAEIIALLPECRVYEANPDAIAIAEESQDDYTPGFGREMAKEIARRSRCGDFSESVDEIARRIMANLKQSANSTNGEKS